MAPPSTYGDASGRAFGAGLMLLAVAAILITLASLTVYRVLDRMLNVVLVENVVLAQRARRGVNKPEWVSPHAN